MSKRYLIALVLLAFAGISSAAIGVAGLLGVTPGSESPIPLASKAVPFTMERIPTSNERLAEIFPDLQIFTLVPENTISAVLGRRAMLDVSSCSELRNQVLAIVQAVFQNPFEGAEHEWELQTIGGEFVAAVRCTWSGGNPYPILELQVAHPPSYAEHQSRLRSY